QGTVRERDAHREAGRGRPEASRSEGEGDDGSREDDLRQGVRSGEGCHGSGTAESCGPGGVRAAEGEGIRICGTPEEHEGPAGERDEHGGRAELPPDRPGRAPEEARRDAGEPPEGDRTTHKREPGTPAEEEG